MLDEPKSRPSKRQQGDGQGDASSDEDSSEESESEGEDVFSEEDQDASVKSLHPNSHADMHTIGRSKGFETKSTVPSAVYEEHLGALFY